MTMSLHVASHQYNKVELRANLNADCVLQAYSYLAQHHPQAPSREQLQALFDQLKVKCLSNVFLGTSCFPTRVLRDANNIVYPHSPSTSNAVRFCR